MSIVLRPLQAITNAPDCYDYCWMKTVIDNIAADEKGRPCRLVQNDDEWHFRQQLLRYGSGLHLTITDQEQLDEFLRHGWLKLTDTPVVIHRFKVDLQQAVDWERTRLTALLGCLDEWRDGPAVKYTNGHMTYFFECRGDDAAGQVWTQLGEFGLTFEPWGPQAVPVETA